MRIEETTYKKMPAELQALFIKLPNYGSQEVMKLFPNSKGMSGGGKHKANYSGGMFGSIDCEHTVRNDNGSAARFFYCAKASKRERNMGCEDLPDSEYDMTHPQQVGTLEDRYSATNKNNHPTVKPLALMTYLCKLVKMPEYNLILDPFMGSGTTLLACRRLGIRAIGIEIEEKYCEIAAKRCLQRQNEY